MFSSFGKSDSFFHRALKNNHFWEGGNELRCGRKESCQPAPQAQVTDCGWHRLAEGLVQGPAAASDDWKSDPRAGEEPQDWPKAEIGAVLP